MAKSVTTDQQANTQGVFQLVASLLDAVDRPMMVSDRAGRILFSNLHAQDRLNAQGLGSKQDLNLFADILNTPGKDVVSQLETGEQEVNLPLKHLESESRARVRWLPEPDWLVVYVEPAPAEAPADEAEMRQTVQELMQEREITYRNLLAAYLRLQEVNRQKTVFLASAAHELEDAARRDEGISRSVDHRLAGKAERSATGNSAGIKRELRPAGSPGFDVPELFRA